MEDQGMEETSDADDAFGSSAYEYDVPSEDSINSDDSCLFHDEDPMDANSYDAWENDTYYNMSESIDEDSKHDATSLVVLDATQQPSIEIMEDAHETAEIIEETLEENNNDPNNNMGSIEMNVAEEEAGPLCVVTDRPGHREAPPPLIVLERGESPKPGCSKDSLPVLTTLPSPREPREPPNEDEILEKTRHILSLVAKIHRDSIFDALYSKNDRVPVSELKLWDLIPETERQEYPEIISSRKEQPREPSDVARSRNASDAVNNIVMQTECTTATNGAKRGPVEDICTVESKKSSSEPDLSISALAVPLPPIPGVSSTSQIANLQTNPNVNRGAIPKMPSKQQSTSIPSKIRIRQRTEFVSASGEIPTLQGNRHWQGMDQPIYGNTGHNPRSIVNQPQFAHAVATRVLYPLPAQVNSSDPFPFASLVREQPSKYPSTGRVSSRPNIAEFDQSKPVQVGVARSVSTPVMPVPLIPTVPIIQQSRKEMENPPAQQQNTKRTVCMEMYYKLRVIFPNVDPEYVKKLCPPEWGPGDRDAQLAPLVEHLLERGDNLPQAPINTTNDSAEQNISYSSVDDIYENLLGIFPDADPHYLRDFAVKNIGNPDALKNFVESKLERRDYPTREQYMARLKITEQQRQYTTGFDVKQFLSIIPDPSKHFMDPKRKCTHQTVAFEFLKSYFNKIRVTTISRAYVQCNHNLSLTAECLERLGADLKSKRGGFEMPTEDILLLQEIAFVKHKAEINNYIANLKKAEDEEFRSLKAMNQLLECQCCYDSECLPSKCSHCDNGHIFCNGCIVTGTSAKMGEDQTRIYCFVNCGSEFSLSVLQRVLVPTTFSILLKKRQAAEVIEAGLEGLVSCPFCHFASIPPEGDKIFKCLNPECTKESCRLCKELSHVPLKCDEVMKADNARRFIEEKMTQALARKCFKCQRAFFKEEGCNKITCPCGAQMCYLCDQPIKGYTHFRGQGSDDRNLCPLYSDTIRMDAVAVRKVAEQAQAQVLKRNPNIKIDTTNLLPAIPRASDGPHNDVLNADELPRRAQRVLDLDAPL